VRDFAADWSRAVARAVFHCDACGAPAARVALLLDERGPGAEGPAGLITQADFYGEWAQVVLAGGLQEVAAAIASADPAALYAVEPLWAPFYCSECERVYCHEHWQFRLVFDEEWTDWYEETVGTCPRGHERVVDD
jgi:hypothetical protein